MNQYLQPDNEAIQEHPDLKAAIATAVEHRRALNAMLENLYEIEPPCKAHVGFKCQRCFYPSRNKLSSCIEFSNYDLSCWDEFVALST